MIGNIGELAKDREGSDFPMHEPSDAPGAPADANRDLPSRRMLIRAATIAALLALGALVGRVSGQELYTLKCYAFASGGSGDTAQAPQDWTLRGDMQWDDSTTSTMVCRELETSVRPSISPGAVVMYPQPHRPDLASSTSAVAEVSPQPSRPDLASSTSGAVVVVQPTQPMRADP